MDGFADELEQVKEESDREHEVEVAEPSETGDTIKTVSPTPDPNQGGIIRPVEDIDGVVEMYEQFEEIKSKLLDEDKDLTDISGKIHVNKSGWRKIATAFNVTTGVKTKRTWERAGVINAEVEAEAKAPNGKTATGMGVASSNESNFMTKLSDDPRYEDPSDSEDIIRVDGKWRVIPDEREVNFHNLIALAETRAKNRAISDLVGGGEVSAEEMDADFFLD